MKKFISFLIAMLFFNCAFANTYIVSNIELNSNVEEKLWDKGYINPLIVKPYQNYYLLNVGREDKIILLNATYENNTSLQFYCNRVLHIMNVTKNLALEGIPNEFFAGLLLISNNKVGLKTESLAQQHKYITEKDCISEDSFNELIDTL